MTTAAAMGRSVWIGRKRKQDATVNMIYLPPGFRDAALYARQIETDNILIQDPTPFQSLLGLLSEPCLLRTWLFEEVLDLHNFPTLLEFSENLRKR
jgi:hypothetical protein